MPYSRRQLGEHEEVLVEARMHPAVLVRPTFISAALVAGSSYAVVDWSSAPEPLRIALFSVGGISLLAGASRVFVWRRRRFVLTNERVILRSGVLHRRSSEIALRQIVTLHTHQRFAERLIGRGRIELQTAAQSEPILIEGVAHPLELARRIDEAIDAALGVERPAVVSRARAVGARLSRLRLLHERGVITSTELDELGDEHADRNDDHGDELPPNVEKGPGW